MYRSVRIQRSLSRSASVVRVTLVVLGLCTACASINWYEVNRENALRRCAELTSEYEREQCEQEWQTSHEEYERERARVPTG